MNKAELIEEIKKVCKVRNDIKIKMVVTGEDWFLDAKYVFLSESGAYVTDTLYLVNIDELDAESLNRIYQKIFLDFPHNENEYSVKCKIVENNQTLFEVQVYAGTREQAKKIADNWNNNAEEIYPQILEILAKN